MIINADLLPLGSVEYDDEPPGHVSIIGLDWEVILNAVIDRGKMSK